MKNKKISILITMCLLMIIGIGKVRAADANLYNGSGFSGGGYGNSGACSTNSPSMLCPYRGTYYFGLKVSIYYIDDGNFSTVKTVSGNTVKSVEIPYEKFGDKLGISVNPNSFTWEEISEKAAKAFGAKTNNYTSISDQPKFKNTFNKVFGINFDTVDFNKDSQLSSSTNPATHGYRIIIEPVIQFYSTGGGYQRFSFKDVAWLLHDGKNGYTDADSNPYKDFAAFLYVKVKDVGISSKTASQCRDKAATEFSSKNFDELYKASSGCGYNIIDISNVVQKCYTRELSGGMTCENYNKNETLFTETYKETSCSKVTKDEQTNTEYGKRITDNNNCNLYCNESAFASFPGKIPEDSPLYSQLTTNGYFMWPNLYDADYFTMHMKSTLTCRVVAKSGKTCSTDDLGQLYNSAKGYLTKLTFAANLTGGTNASIIGKPLNSEHSSVSEPKSISWDKNGQISNTFVISKTVYFEIDGYNRFYNPATGKASKDFKNGYIDRGHGNISHNLNEDANVKHELKISGVILGSGNQFGDRIKNYTCPYTFTTSCKCPDDTCYPGRDLHTFIEAGFECPAAQKIACNLGVKELEKKYKKTYEEIVKEEEYKTDADRPKVCKYYCTTNDSVDITKCVDELWATGKYRSKDDAVEVCTKKNIKCDAYKCDSDTSVDITACVHEKAPGKNQFDNREDINKAKEECEEIQRKSGRCMLSCADEVVKCQKEDPTKSVYECQIEKNPLCKNAKPEEMGKCLQSCPGTCVYKGSKITQYLECMKEVNNHAKCYSAWCQHSTCDPNKEPCYYCLGKPATTEYDITKCVVDKVAAGQKSGNEISIKTAKQQCSAENSKCKTGTTCKVGCKWVTEQKGNTTYYYKKCSDTNQKCEPKTLNCPNGKCPKVIYRIIDLNNPFPGKEGKGNVTEFSNGGSGRFPNSNWNYAPLVKEKILNARGAKGDELYKRKPLYTIVLTPSDMKKIKSSTDGYNKGKNYDDFTLNCLNNSQHDACVSTFLHSGEYVKIDTSNSESRCANITNADEFRACYESTN